MISLREQQHILHFILRYIVQLLKYVLFFLRFVVNLLNGSDYIRDQTDGEDNCAGRVTVYDPFEDTDSRVVDWLELPGHLLSTIAEKLSGVDDYVRFGAVCKSWRSAYLESQPRCLPHQLPLLMLPTPITHDNQTRSLYDLSRKRVLDVQVPVPHNRLCRGCSFGWLVTVLENYEVRLLNPFVSIENEIHLPPLTAFEFHDENHGIWGCEYLRKAVVSANPTSNPNYAIMAIHGGFNRIAFFKPGDKVWTNLDSTYTLVNDVIYYGYQFYFVDDYGALFGCDLNQPHHPKVSRVAPPIGVHGEETKYLVESGGDLLLVIRTRRYHENTYSSITYSSIGFVVCKLNTNEHKWTEVKSLLGHSVFIGDNSSFSLLASDFPGCKPNCIYFTDDFLEGYYEASDRGVGPHDIGVFNLEDCSFEAHYPLECAMIIPAPIWIEPTLNKDLN